MEVQRLGQGASVLGASGGSMEAHVQRAVRLATRLKLPVVATHPVQFVKREDFRAHEARVCIAQGYILSDQRRPRLFHPEQHFRTQQEMAAAFKKLFKEADRNRDGVLDERELAEAMQKLMPPPRPFGNPFGGPGGGPAPAPRGGRR